MIANLDFWNRDLRQASGSSAPRVILAEDDHEFRWQLATALREDGYEVIEASGGPELIELIAEHLDPSNDTACDLLITGIGLPGGTGLKVLEMLRQKDRAIRLIIITGFCSEEVKLEARRLGVTAVFEKPFDFDKFRAAVMHLLAPQRAALALAAL